MLISMSTDVIKGNYVYKVICIEKIKQLARITDDAKNLPATFVGPVTFVITIAGVCSTTIQVAVEGCVYKKILQT